MTPRRASPTASTIPHARAAIAPLLAPAVVASLGCAPRAPFEARAPLRPDEGRAIVEVPWEPGPLPTVPGARAPAISRRGAMLGQAPSAIVSADAEAPTTRLVIDAGVLGHDPQVAVGDRHLIVFTAHRYQILDRATGAVLPSEEGDEIPTSGDFNTLFSPLWAPRDKQGRPNAANINLRLHFADDDPLRCDPEEPLGSRACVRELYDTRILWDPARRRFWIASAARNHLWKCEPSAKRTCAEEKFSSTQARRFIAVAVSRAEDPRKGFHRYVLVERYTDWPKIGLGGRYLFLGHRANPVFHVFDADRLAAGNPGGGPVRVAVIDGARVPGVKFVIPVNHHGPPGGVAFFLGTNGTESVTPFALVDRDPARRDPPLVVPGPEIRIGARIGALETNAVYQGGNLHASWEERVGGAAEGGPRRRVRVIRLPVAMAPGAPPRLLSTNDAAHGFRDVSLGGREPDDAADADIDYAKPALDVNARGDAVIVYSRRGRGAGLAPEVRYSILRAGERTPQPGVLVRRGSTDDVPDIDDNAAAGIDLACAQLDPSDDRTVWITHAYADGAARWFKQIVAAVQP